MSTLKVNAIEPYSGGTVTITGLAGSIENAVSASYAENANNLTAGNKTLNGTINQTFAAPVGGQTDLFTVTGAVTEGAAYPVFTVGLQDYGGPDFGDSFTTEIFGAGFAYGTGHSVSGKGLFVNVAPNGGGTPGKLRVEDSGGATSKATIQATNVEISGSNVNVNSSIQATGTVYDNLDMSTAGITAVSQLNNVVGRNGETFALTVDGVAKVGDPQLDGKVTIFAQPGQYFSALGVGPNAIRAALSPSGSGLESHIKLVDDGDTTTTVSVNGTDINIGDSGTTNNINISRAGVTTNVNGSLNANQGLNANDNINLNYPGAQKNIIVNVSGSTSYSLGGFDAGGKGYGNVYSTAAGGFNITEASTIPNSVLNFNSESGSVLIGAGPGKTVREQQDKYQTILFGGGWSVGNRAGSGEDFNAGFSNIYGLNMWSNNYSQDLGWAMNLNSVTGTGNTKNGLYSNYGASYADLISFQDANTFTDGAITVHQILKTETEVSVGTQLVLLDYANLDFANDGAAAAGGVPIGGIYHNNSDVRIRIT